ncbi:FAD-binding oxidoreductase [Oerskovia turbata]
MSASANSVVRGEHQHAQAVASLVRSVAAVEPGRPLRLAKRTTNLFRPRRPASGPGLDVSGLTGVISLDESAGTADVQGMCAYEDLVAVTLPHGLVPTVVPQLRTITAGGAVAGLGIESSSLRNGLPHEAVLELDVLTPAGEVVTATPGNEHADLFHAFPNSYGTLGYATRVRLRLDRAEPFVVVRNVRFDSVAEAAASVGKVAADGSWEGERVDFCDGVVFGPGEVFLCLGRFASGAEAQAVAPAPSDYTGQRIYYRSLRERSVDVLSAHDYLWRWDTDWFWCSRAFGVQNPVVRRVWPRRWRRSDVYRRIVGLDERLDLTGRLADLRRRPRSERVVQDVEVPLDQLESFMGWFADRVRMSPVWLCPLRLSSSEPWPLYPLEPGRVYVNVGFWGGVPIAEGAQDGDVNRLIEMAVAVRHGHKSLYSTATYDREVFDTLYGGLGYAAVKGRYDPGGRAPTLYEKAVRGA